MGREVGGGRVFDCWFNLLTDHGSVQNFLFLYDSVLINYISRNLSILDYPICWCIIVHSYFFFKNFYLLYFREKEGKSMSRGEGQRGWERENPRQAPCPSQSPIWGSIPQPWTKIKSQTLNWLRHPGTPIVASYVFSFIFLCLLFHFWFYLFEYFFNVAKSLSVLLIFSKNHLLVLLVFFYCFSILVSFLCAVLIYFPAALSFSFSSSLRCELGCWFLGIFKNIISFYLSALRYLLLFSFKNEHIKMLI